MNYSHLKKKAMQKVTTAQKIECLERRMKRLEMRKDTPINKAEAAELLRCSVQKIEKLIRDRAFPTYKVGGTVLMMRGEIMDYVEANRTPSEKELDIYASTWVATHPLF